MPRATIGRGAQRAPTGLFADAFARRLPRLLLPRDRFRLQEEPEVVAAARLRIRPRHVEAAERMRADERAGALAVDVEVADEELVLGAADLLLIIGEYGAGEAVLRVVRDA